MVFFINCLLDKECDQDEYRCERADVCLPQRMICDGDIHCPYGDDESNCKDCKNDARFCSQLGRCLPKWDICNGVKDCDDGSDEIVNCFCF